MLCSKCYKKITQDEEIQVQGTIFCKKCTRGESKLLKKEIVTKCHSCNNFIYNNERTYESNIDSTPFINFSILILIKYIIQTNYSEKVIECEKCYQKRRIKYKEWKKRLEKRERLLIVFEVVFFLSLAYFFYPDFWKAKILNFDEMAINLIVLFISLFIVQKILISSFKIKSQKNTDLKKRKMMKGSSFFGRESS